MYLVKADVLGNHGDMDKLFFTELENANEMKKIINSETAMLIMLDNLRPEFHIQCTPWGTLDAQLMGMKYEFKGFVKPSTPELREALRNEPIMSIRRLYKCFVPREFHSKVALKKITINGVGPGDFPLW